MERSGRVWRVRSLEAARGVLRARGETRQAGFTAEYVPKGWLKHHPILMSDGPLHDEQRSKVARFFAPAVVAERYGEAMAASADALLSRADAAGGVRLDDLALLYSVEVTSRIVGLTESSVPRMARRLVTFFRQPPFDITQPSGPDAPAVGARRRERAAADRALLCGGRPAAIHPAPARAADDIVSHLIGRGTPTSTSSSSASPTARRHGHDAEFITMAAWHLLADDGLQRSGPPGSASGTRS